MSRFPKFCPRSVCTFPKRWSPPISDMENSKIKVSWPNKKMAGLFEVPNTTWRFSRNLLLLV